MAIQAMALGLDKPNIDALGSYQKGAEARQAFDSNQIKIAQQGLETIGSIALGAMGGNIDGQADPALFEQGLDYLANNGVAAAESFRGRPDLAPLVARSSMSAMQQLAQARDERSYELAMKKFEFDMQQALANPSGKESFFGNTVYMRNPETGEVIAGQVSNQGNFNPINAGEGFQPAIPVEQLNTGTGFTGVTKYGDNTGAVTPIDNFAEAFDTEAGKAAAAKIEGLSAKLATADNMLATIDGVLKDPALDVSTGWLSWMQGVPGTDQYRFGQRALQLQGQAFLQAFNDLKGGGAITETEGKKAEQAIGRLSTAQRPEDYRSSLDELKGIINASKGRTAAIATAPRPQAPVAQSSIASPPTGRQPNIPVNAQMPTDIPESSWSTVATIPTNGAPSGIPTVADDAAYDALSSGDHFLDPDGNERIKP